MNKKYNFQDNDAYPYPLCYYYHKFVTVHYLKYTWLTRRFGKCLYSRLQFTGSHCTDRSVIPFFE